ncbi:MAG: DinB family protein [Terriglobales bacterium]
MAKKTVKPKSRKKSAKPASNRSAAGPASVDQLLRNHLVDLLTGGRAHTTFDAAMGDWPVQLAGVKVANFPHTAWMLVEHMRIGQWDILEFSRDPKHVSPKWPEGYWPASDAPPNEKEWKASMAAFKKDLKSMAQFVGNRKNDLSAGIPWGDGQTILREALLVADHNAYHLGQLVMLRKSIGI